MTDQKVTQELLVMRESKPIWRKWRNSGRWLSNYKVIDRQSHQPLLLIRKDFGKPHRIIDPADDRTLFTLRSRFNLFKYLFLLEGTNKIVHGRIEAPIWRWRYHIRLITDSGQEFQYYSNDFEGDLKDGTGKIVMKLHNYWPTVDPDFKNRADQTWIEYYIIELFQSERYITSAAEFNPMELLAIASLPIRTKWQNKM